MEDVVRGLSLEMPDKSISVASSPGAASSVGFTCGFMAVVLLFLLPANLLFMLGIGYDVPSSFPAYKIHPATYLTAFGLVATLLAVLQRKTVTGLAEWRVPIIYVLLTVLCAMCSFVSVGTAGASNYIDTFLAAGALAMILATGDLHQRRRLGYTLMALVLLNVILSFWESVSTTHLIPLHISTFDLRKVVGKEGNDFRPAGLYPHPLMAACVTSMGVWLLLSMRLRPWLSGVAIALPRRRVIQLRRTRHFVDYTWRRRRRRRHFSSDKACQSRTDSTYPQLAHSWPYCFCRSCSFYSAAKPTSAIGL